MRRALFSVAAERVALRATALTTPNRCQAVTNMEHRMVKLSTVFATAALLIVAAAPSFAGNTTAAGSSSSHTSDIDSARSNGTSGRNGTSGVSTPSDSGSAGTITNGQSAQMPTSNSATRQDTDTNAAPSLDRDRSRQSGAGSLAADKGSIQARRGLAAGFESVTI